MLKVTGLNKSYGSQELLDNVSFILNPGEKAGLVGRNGAGKTTLFKLILGQEEPDEGVISVPRNYRIGYLSQHINFTKDTVLKEAALSLPEREDGADETYKVKRILTGLGLGGDTFGLNPLALSGGYQVRLNLAKALASEPNLLMLDEPTNYLDIVSIRWLKRFLKDWRGELVLITHDRDFMDSCITHTIGIHRRKVKKIHGPTQRLYSQILQEEEVYEQTRLNDDKKRKEVERFINRFRAQATRASAVQSRIKALERHERLKELEYIKELDFEFNPAPFAGKTLIEVDALSFGFTDKPLIKNLGFSVNKKDRIAIIGKNGKGKTTLLNLLAGELNPSEGAVKRHPGLKPGYFGQTNINRLDLKKTIEEELISAHPDFSRSAARRACGAMMFEDDNALKKIEVLSGGERSRVLLARLLLTPSNLLLLDEPTNHLDMESIDSLIDALAAFEGAVIIVTHSEMILESLATRLIVFDGGVQSVFEGTYRDFLDKVGWEDEGLEAGSSGSNRAQKTVNKKEARKIRAEIALERVRILGPLQKKIAGLEGGITKLEGEAENVSHELARASEKGDGQEISMLSRSFHEIRARIDEMFDELERITLEHDSMAREFESRLEEVG
ncbi:MAG: ABC-F family ATP-binding cassette domain-containing protein [Deltaproteobacteria bacterium]|nr:ABC-F family ATP-binding cassette domain-containing protein [Deltaproteobacteria bacterium]